MKLKLFFITLFIIGYTSNVQPQELKFEVIKTSFDSSPSKIKGVYSIYCTNRLKDVWKNAFDTYSIPEIDFDTELVIAIFRGSCPSLGYSVFVEKIEETEDSIIVYIVYRNPGEYCRQRYAISCPYVIIKIKQTNKYLEFVEHEKITDCR